MSLPAVNASPSASNSTTRTAGSLSARVSASPMATYIAFVSAFFFLGPRERDAHDVVYDAI